jgi:hypothetical protein
MLKGKFLFPNLHFYPAPKPNPSRQVQEKDVEKDEEEDKEALCAQGG